MIGLRFLSKISYKKIIGIVSFISYYLTVFVAYLITSYLDIVPEQEFLLINLSSISLTILFFATLFIKKDRQEILPYFKKINLFGTGFIYGLLFILIIFVPYCFLNSNINLPSNILFLYIILGTFIQSFSEEIYFRLFIIIELKKKYNIYTTLIIQALFFSILHYNIFSNLFENICRVTSIFFISIILGFLIIKYNNIWISIGLHFAWNIISSTVSFYNQNISLETQTLTPIICISIVLIYIIANKRKIAINET